MPVPQPSNLRILLIDNDAATRDLVKADLERMGHSVTVAEDGSQGVEVARQNPPQLVVIDLQMDPTGGEAVWAEIGRDPRLANVPGIFCSLQRYATIRRVVGERPRTTLYKPFRFQELQTAIANAMATVRPAGA